MRFVKKPHLWLISSLICFSAPFWLSGEQKIVFCDFLSMLLGILIIVANRFIAHFDQWEGLTRDLTWVEGEDDADLDLRKEPRLTRQRWRDN